MKIRKISILALFSACLLIGFVFSVTADEILEDDENDVIVTDLTGSMSKTDEKPNIDIKKLTYIKSEGEKKATLIFEVYGEIENRGDIDDEASLYDSVMYSINLITSEGYYQILYINEKCQLLSDFSEENITDFTVDGGVLTINFDLYNSSETYEEMYAETIDIKFDEFAEGGFLFADTIPDEYDSLLTVYAGGYYEGEVGEEIYFSGEIYLGEPPYSYKWDFGDGETSTESDPSHSYENPGEYTVIFSVTDDTGVTQNDTAVVTISEKQTSNGDDEGSGSALILFFAIIAIIIIIGIIVLFLIIRR